MLPKGRQLLIGALVFAAVMGVGAWPSDTVRFGFSTFVSAVSNATLGYMRFDSGARVMLAPLPKGVKRGANDNVEADTSVSLHWPGAPPRVGYTMSSRRDAYLPLVIFVAVILAMPLGLRRKLVCLAVGVPVTLAVALSSVAIVVTYLFSQSPGNVIPKWQGAAAEFLFERWLSPPGNRVIAPLLFGLALGLAAKHFRMPRGARSAEENPQAAVPHAPAG